MKSCGIYVHIPFCIQKCLYCDFYSVSGAGQAPTYCSRLLEEIRQADLKEYTAGSIFFGGGTPTFLPSFLLTKILRAIKGKAALQKDCEITVECNPKTAGKAYFMELLEAGFNRLSVGAQSFHDNELALLGRAHNSKDVALCLREAAEAGFSNISLDLMVGIPGQTLESLHESIVKALNFTELKHISLYGLMIEAGTPFAKMDLDLPAEDDLLAMLDLGVALLENAGYRQYEISNFAKPGKECKHNLNYWRRGEYFGFGAAAHSFIHGKRYSNSANILQYVRCDEAPLSTKDAMFEKVMLALRLTEGLDKAEFKNEFHIDFEKQYADVIAKYSEFSENTQTHFRLTRWGMQVSNTILSDFIII